MSPEPNCRPQGVHCFTLVIGDINPANTAIREKYQLLARPNRHVASGIQENLGGIRYGAIDTSARKVLLRRVYESICVRSGACIDLADYFTAGRQGKCVTAE